MDNQWSNLRIKDAPTQSRHKVDYQYGRYKTKKYTDQNGRLVNTKQYAIAWGIINKPYSSKQLYIKCRDQKAPSYYFIVRKAWKGYQDYYNDLVKHGMQRRPPRTEQERRKLLGKIEKRGFKTGLLDKDYDLVKMAAEYGVTSVISYNKIREDKKESKIFLPSVVTIYKRYGTWKRFIYLVRQYNTDYILDIYVRESAKIGHWLTLLQCDKLKIPIRKIMRILKPSIFNAVCYKKLSLMGKKL